MAKLYPKQQALSMDILEYKRELRDKMLTQRDNMDGAVKEIFDREICDKLWSLILKERPGSVHVFIPFRSEIDISPLFPLLWEKGIPTITSIIMDHGQLRHVRFFSLDEIIRGRFGVPYPSDGIPFEESPDLIVVPGLAFDSHGKRIGYGGGYYDRFLSGFPEAHKIGVCYPFQLLDLLHEESHDVRVDQVVVPK